MTISIEQIQQFIDNRPILIVGASVDLAGQPIEFEGVTVRLNTSRRWGSCDIWFLNTSTDYYEYQASQNGMDERYIIRGNGDRDGANMRRNYPPEWEGHTFFWDPDEWKLMTEEIGIERPLTGTIATYWFKRYTESEITLLNFDFYQNYKINPVRKTMLAPVHTPELDSQYITNLEGVNLVSTF
jgi:hypothetical protein